MSPSEFTSRQLDVLRLTALDFNRKTITDKLGLSIKTVDFHIYALRKKLKVKGGLCIFAHYALHYKLIENFYEKEI